jgi:ABC-type lipoprotein release transport system permease subunit
MLQGVLIGVVGTAIGLTLGYSLSHSRRSLPLAAFERKMSIR